MSESPKKPAGRDISDLKARLGLKKGGEAGPRTAAMPAQGVPPPSAAKIGGFVPPPPGVAPPPGMAPPPQPEIPDASVDPFGAMNAMARTAATTSPPPQEFVIVNDGRPVEQVSSSGKAIRFVKIGVLVLAPLFVGYVGGGIMAGNKAWNKTISDVKLLYADFQEVGKSLTSLQEQLDVAKDRGGGKFKYPDNDLTTALEGLQLKSPDKTVLFHSNVRNLDAAIVEKTFKFYTDLTILYAKVDEHKRLSKADERKTVPKQQGQYAVVLRVPKGDQPDAIPLVEIVEVGAPICGADTKINPQGCPPGVPVTQFQVRSDPNGGWQLLPFVTKDVVADGVIAFQPNKMQSAFMVGADNFIDAIGYQRRITEIDTMVRELSETRAQLQTILNAEAQRDTRFAL